MIQARDVFTWLGLRVRGSVFAVVYPLLLTMVGLGVWLILVFV